MKTTTVPAQVTTVEDKIAGNLSFTQLFILALPVFVSGGLYVALPPFITMSAFKIVISAVVLIVCLSLAVRLRGKLVIQWLVVISRYNLRPRYFVYNKNDTYLRNLSNLATSEKEQNTSDIKQAMPRLLPRINFTQRVRLEEAISDPRAKAHFEVNKRGGLHVRITEVKQES